MNPNETIGKWAVEKGLLDCWHNVTSSINGHYCTCIRRFTPVSGNGGFKPRNRAWQEDHTNPDYTIYENIAPVLDELIEQGYDICLMVGLKIMNEVPSFINLPTTLRDMVAELIDKGEV